MRNLFRFLKPYAGAVVGILVVLFVQAFCDLSLPSYTSDIVNVGIQQGGIDTSIPEQISVKDMENLLLFVDEDGQNTVLENYKKDSETYKEDAYVLKEDAEKNEKTMDELSGVLGKPMLLVESLSSDSEQSRQIKEGLLQAMPRGAVSGDADIFEILKMMPEEAKDQMTSGMTEEMSDMPDTMVEQAATVYIKQVYRNLDLDTDHIQTMYILKTGAKMLALAFLGMAASITVGFMASKVAASAGRDIRKNVFTKVVGFSNAEFDKFSTASLITRSTNDIQQIQLLSVMLLRMVLYAPILGLGGVYKVFNTNVDMSWILAVAVGLIIMVVLVLFACVMPKFKILQTLVDKLNLVSREILTGLPVIRAFHREKHEEERFDSANKNLMKTNLFVNRAMTFMMPVMMLIMNGISVLIVWTGAHGIDKGQMQVGDMMAFIQYTMQIIMAFLMICMISVMLPRAAVAADRVREVLDSKTAIGDPERPEKFEGNEKGILVFDHVSFRYPGAEENVLHDISFAARPGETTAVIGSTGSGKSTLVNLIPRFYDVTQGKITLDGKDIRDISQHDLRERLGYVPQKGVLFSGTIESNILYGNQNGTKEEMEEAAKIAQATEFIETKPAKYEEYISQGGANVSGGQKQRLSIARAIAKHPDVFIFDDSFSALDYKTDVTLRKELKEHTANSTVILVAQRISTILHAEQIIVLDEGKVAGIGTHRELLNNCEVYRQIALSQLSEEELKNDMEKGKEE
ncbi:ABC transporter ATP-binding protein [Lachnoclostridium sp. An181]|uniref:ABC transporter ATP-binding protein n=1 Tax=Lachnoclostridium sp. An181 TaxID=1965575 RepID=UPI000B389C1F|nr:ABC transporter ATP-binding protein [Lachnoclostridium sp. An181]OUP49681.1 ABC transporter [Lachnoclostridium sp. An181]